MAAPRCIFGVVVASYIATSAAWCQLPAGIRPARRGSTASILPGGRVIAPRGTQYPTGGNPVALALSKSGKFLATANLDPSQPSLTLLETSHQAWEVRQIRVPRGAAEDDWHSVAGGLVFEGERSVLVSEGDTGRVAWIDLDSGERRRSLNLGAGSITGDLALDAVRGILYVADLAHSTVVALDTKTRQPLGSVKVGGVPVALALAPDRRTLYAATITNLLTGGPEQTSGVAIINVNEPSAPQLEAVISLRVSSGLVAAGDRVYAVDAEREAVAVIDARSRRIETEIELRIPGFEKLTGILPAGLAYDEKSGWLLVAEPGINAIGVIDGSSQKLLGHMPAGWFPTQVLTEKGTVFVANAKGPGSGLRTRGDPWAGGSVSSFPIPAGSELAADTQFVMEAAGLKRPAAPPELPSGIRHVVMIVKGSATFDEVLGDVARVSNGPVLGAPALARYGHDGEANGLGERLSLHHIQITPNQHAIATQWAFSDNFYAEGNESEGLRWLALGKHLVGHGVSFARFEPDADREARDTDRAAAVIRELEERYGKNRAELPRVVWIRLRNDRPVRPRPDQGYPYPESYVADNDLALGRILEYLSGTAWWGQMAVFVTEASAEGGVDHVDPHRTLLFCAGPWARRNVVVHTNTSFPGLVKTVLQLAGAPPMNLADSSAAGVNECLSSSPDPAAYRALPVDERVYAAGLATNR